MTQHLTRALAVVVGATTLAFGVAAAAAPAGASSGAATTAASSGNVGVAVGDNYFKADEVEITAGTKVTWKNGGTNLHNVTAVKGKFGTRALARGKTYTYRFKKPGTYTYYCSFHGSPTGGQHGTITVVAAPKVTTTTTAAAG